MHKREKIITVLLAALFCMTGRTAEKASLWDYANPAADVILYVNTRQPEKAMDKELWKRICRDKEQAIAQDPDGQFFNTKGRDMELIANLQVYTMTPFCGSIDGVANITGNLKGDIAKLLGALKENKAPQPQITRQGDKQFYSMSITEMGELPPMDVMFVPVGSNQIQFRIHFTPKGKMKLNLAGASSRPVPLIAKLKGRELAFACAAYAEKFAAAPAADTDNARELQDFLRKIKDLCVSGYVNGKFLIVDTVFSFRNVEDASVFEEKMKPVLAQIMAATGAKKVPNIVLNGERLAITLQIDIAQSWDLISRITSGSQPKPVRRSEPKQGPLNLPPPNRRK